jgi:hypothetical protein
VRTLRQQIRLGGETIFEPHPEIGALRDFARGRGGGGQDVGRHVEICATCRLEAEGLRRRPQARQAGLRVERAGATWLRLGFATTAAAILGLMAGWRFHPVPTRPPLESSVGAVPGGAEAPGAQEPAPVPVLHLLPGLVRGQPAAQRWTLDPGELRMSVAVPLTLPSTAGDSERFRFELRRQGAETIAGQEMTVARIREHLEASEVVNLVLAPARPLAAGVYEFRVVPAGPSGGAPIYRARITIDYRQSPAATKAPQ